jgi:hypothetical protein
MALPQLLLGSSSDVVFHLVMPPIHERFGGILVFYGARPPCEV